MVVKVYDNAAEYLIDNEEALLEQEAVSQLVLYDAYKSRQSPRRFRIIRRGYRLRTYHIAF